MEDRFEVFRQSTLRSLVFEFLQLISHLLACNLATVSKRVVSGLLVEQVVECQDGRSQHANYDKAMKVLRSKLYELEIKKQNEEIAGQRKSMVGSGDRSDKIRTYNYPQARVTDHRINYTVYNLTEIVSGNLFSFTEKLRIAENAERMKTGNND